MSTGSLLTSTGTKTLFVFVASSTGFCLTKFNSRKLYMHQAFKSETCEVYVAKESSFTSNTKSVISKVMEAGYSSLQVHVDRIYGKQSG